MTTQKEGAPPCGLYYRLSGFDNDTRSHSDILRDLRQIAMVINRSSGYERNMFVIEIDAGAFGEKDVNIFTNTVQADGGVVLLRGVKPTQKRTADGFIVDDVPALKSARKTLGDDYIIGMDCGVSKDTAQSAFDHGVDFVSFGIENYGTADVKLISWWAGLSDKPALAMGAITAQNCDLYAQSGAGFVDTTAYINNHDDGLLQATVNILHVLAQADI